MQTGSYYPFDLLYYYLYFTCLILFATLLDFSGIFDSFSSKYAKLSYENLKEIIFNWKLRLDYTKSLPYGGRNCLRSSCCCENPHLHIARDSQLQDSQLNHFRENWEVGYILDTKEVKESSSICCPCWKAEKFSPIYFSEFMHLVYLSTTPISTAKLFHKYEWKFLSISLPVGYFVSLYRISILYLFYFVSFY
jgi:hypothetical protein